MDRSGVRKNTGLPGSPPRKGPRRDGPLPCGRSAAGCPSAAAGRSPQSPGFFLLQAIRFFYVLFSLQPDLVSKRLHFLTPGADVPPAIHAHAAQGVRAKVDGDVDERQSLVPASLIQGVPE